MGRGRTQTGSHRTPCWGTSTESGEIRVCRRSCRVRCGIARPSVTPRLAGGTHDRRREGHARRGGRYGHIAVRSRPRPPHLDRLRGLRWADIAIQTLAAKALQLDLALSDYGPEANGVRAQVRQALGKTIDEIWGSKEGDAFIANNFATAIHNMRAREASLAGLHPSTDAQKDALAAAKAAVDSIGQSRLQITFALASPVSIPLIIIVVAWAAFLFFAYGLMSGGSLTSFVATTAGALAIASAAYLILDLSSPYSGLFRPSPAPFEQVMGVTGKE